MTKQIHYKTIALFKAEMCISFTLWFILGVLGITFAHHLTFPIPHYIIITPLSFYLLGWSTLLETGSLACLFFGGGGIEC